MKMIVLSFNNKLLVKRVIAAPGEWFDLDKDGNVYVDGKLVYITKWLPALRLRELNDLYEKQEGVPYNISIGGGSQGLADVVQQNYMIEATRLYPIEQYFAGTFIGYMRNFRIFKKSKPSRTIFKLG